MKLQTTKAIVHALRGTHHSWANEELSNYWNCLDHSYPI